MLKAALHGFILAFPLIMPLGAQNVFIFNQGALQDRFSKALPVIITAAICDTILIAMAVTGVSLVVLGSVWMKTTLLGGGLIFLLYMGWHTWKSIPGSYENALMQNTSPQKQILFALSVSLLNPHAIMDTVGVIGTNSLNYEGESKVAFAAATIIVSWIWFFSLAFAGRITGKMDSSGRLVTWLNKVSALVMWGAAGYIAYSLLA